MPHVRLSVRGRKMMCFDCFSWPSLDLLVDIAKAIVGFARRFRPTYAEANVGHPSNSYWVLLGHGLRRLKRLRKKCCLDRVPPRLLSRIHCKAFTYSLGPCGVAFLY